MDTGGGGGGGADTPLGTVLVGNKHGSYFNIVRVSKCMYTYIQVVTLMLKKKNETRYKTFCLRKLVVYRI